MRGQEYTEFHIMLVLRCLSSVCEAHWMGILFVSMAICHLFVAMTAERLTGANADSVLGAEALLTILIESRPVSQ